MRTLFIFLLLVTMASADTISDKVFDINGCDLTFRQGPYGPCEAGDAVITCTTKTGNVTTIETNSYPYQFEDPMLDVAGLKFVLVDGTLWYLDPAGIRINEK
jgi:hypothetical protein